MASTDAFVATEYTPPGGELQVLEVNGEQLHGRACFICGAADEPLTAAGHVYTAGREDARFGWPVVACAPHRVGR